MDPRSLSPTQASIIAFQNAFASGDPQMLVKWYNQYAPWLSKETVQEYVKDQQLVQLKKQNQEVQQNLVQQLEEIQIQNEKIVVEENKQNQFNL